MSKPTKPKKERPKKYDEPLKVNAGFLDIIQASVKQAQNKQSKKEGNA